MLDILQYSTIILAGNLTVLLVISLATDYWEYRGFHKEEIESKIKLKGEPTDLVKVPDTDSYIVINHTRYYNIDKPLATSEAKLRRRIASTTTTSTTTEFMPARTASVVGRRRQKARATFYEEYDLEIYEPPCLMKKTFFKKVHNCSIANEVNKLCGDVVFLVLFEEYGNLFRDCDNLESGVRSRLEMGSSACHFVFTQNDGQLPAIKHLEIAAFAFALLALASMLVNLSAGVYGSSVKHRALLLTASFASLGAGISYTVAIALFHAKCHLIHLREFIKNEDIPYKEVIESARTYEFGWSFVLAWICVVLSFTSAWTWLYKSQDLRPKFITQKLKSHLIGSKITSKTLSAARAAAAEIARRNASQALLSQLNTEPVEAEGTKHADLLSSIRATSNTPAIKSPVAGRHHHRRRHHHHKSDHSRNSKKPPGITTEDEIENLGSEKPEVTAVNGSAKTGEINHLAGEDDKTKTNKMKRDKKKSKLKEKKAAKGKDSKPAAQMSSSEHDIIDVPLSSSFDV